VAHDNLAVSWIALAIAASSLGFLGHNWAPARIFMGDVGSTFLGYSFAVLPLFAKPVAPLSPVIGALIMAPFLFDTGFTLLRRWRNGEHLMAAHRSHLYQRLLVTGLSHRFVAVLYMALTALGCILAVLASDNDPANDVWVFIGLVMMLGSLWSFVQLRERRRAALSWSISFESQPRDRE
jgi:UDP-N-acetylmuramyl pentapeptide phosphotransferase/UDP-N-acetylglucosamine-1-phosphate transferase